MLCVTRGAGRNSADPAWSAAIVQVPGLLSVTLVSVAVASVHVDSVKVLRITGSDELASAATKYVPPTRSGAGGTVV